MILFLKKHKIGVIIVSIFVIIIIAMFVFVRSIFVSGHEGIIYGNRLEGIDKVRINEDTLTNIADEIKKNEQVKKVSKRLEGKLLNFMIDVSNETTLENAKKLVEPIINSLTEKEQSFYDIQVMITCNENEKSEIYPIISYKHKTSSEFVW